MLRPDFENLGVQLLQPLGQDTQVERVLAAHPRAREGHLRVLTLDASEIGVRTLHGDKTLRRLPQIRQISHQQLGTRLVPDHSLDLGGAGLVQVLRSGKRPEGLLTRLRLLRTQDHRTSVQIGYVHHVTQTSGRLLLKSLQTRHHALTLHPPGLAVGVYRNPGTRRLLQGPPVETHVVLGTEYPHELLVEQVRGRQRLPILDNMGHPTDNLQHLIVTLHAAQIETLVGRLLGPLTAYPGGTQLE